MKGFFDDMFCLSEGGIGRAHIAEDGIDKCVVFHLVPNRRLTGLERLIRFRDVIERLVIDLDHFGGVQRFVHGFGNNHCDGLADMARLVGRQKKMWPDKYFAPAGTGELHVVFGFRNGTMRDRL